MTSIFSNSAHLGVRAFVSTFVVVLGLALSSSALADSKKNDTGLMPATNSADTAQEYTVTGGETHPPIRLTPDKTEIVMLDDNAYSIIIGNPAHLNVLLENPQMLLLAARQPGATQLTVLNLEGKVIMQRHVIVSGPKDEYVRIRRSCINSSRGCEQTTVYYCPGICHDVRLLAGQANNNGNPGAVIPSRYNRPPRTGENGTNGNDTFNDDNTDVDNAPLP